MRAKSVKRRSVQPSSIASPDDTVRRLINCVTVVIEDGLPQDVTLTAERVEMPSTRTTATLRVETRNYDVYDEGSESVARDERDRPYYQTLYFFDTL